jgi:catechol 2,3-dioxygenase-like lactoylglutathione lyase family enzyme
VGWCCCGLVLLWAGLSRANTPHQTGRVTGERTYPVLPCPDLDEALDFYRALGFAVTFVQHRPYGAAVVARDDIHIHLASIAGFDPEASYTSVIITVPDPGALHQSFTEGLRSAYGKVPVAGIPRLLRPRRKAGTATGFTVVDVGGNWLRFYRTPNPGGDEPENDTLTTAPRDAYTEENEPVHTGLARVIDVAARQGDARGDDEQAIRVLDAGLLRHPDAPPADRFEAILYRAELKLRAGRDTAPDLALAQALLESHTLGDVAEQRLAELRQSMP